MDIGVARPILIQKKISKALQNNDIHPQKYKCGKIVLIIYIFGTWSIYLLFCDHQVTEYVYWEMHICISGPICWEKSIKGKSINGLPMHGERAHYGVCRKKCFISYVNISHVNSLASIDKSICTLKTFPCILSFECRDIEGIADMSSRVSWHFMTRSYKCKEHPLIGNYSLVERRMVIPYDTIEGKNAVTGNLSCLSPLLLLSI